MPKKLPKENLKKVSGAKGAVTSETLTQSKGKVRSAEPGLQPKNIPFKGKNVDSDIIF